MERCVSELPARFVGKNKKSTEAVLLRGELELWNHLRNCGEKHRVLVSHIRTCADVQLDK